MATSPVPGVQQTTRGTRSTRAAARSKRTIGEDAVPARGHSANHVPADFRSIKGWGADLDPANRPAVPRELPSDVLTLRGDVKAWQQPRSRVHQSNEHPDLTPVFGDSCPPHGISGKIRDLAYQYSEGRARHWMLLMFADRVDNVESFVGNLLRGKPDNYVAEKGWGTLIRRGGPRQRARVALWGAGALALVGLAIARRKGSGSGQ